VVVPDISHLLTVAALPVRCVNCGGDNSLSLILSIISLVVAIIAAFAAARLYNMQKEEHRVFMAELSRRAQIAITVEPASYVKSAPNGAPVGRLILRLTFDNTGTKAAHNATVNVLVPDSVEHVERCREDGSPFPDSMSAVTSVQDVPWNGTSKTLDWKWDVLTLATKRVAWVCVSLRVGAECPIHVNLASDDLPEPYQVNCDYTARAPSSKPPLPPAAVPEQ